MKKDFLFEIGCAELPAKGLQNLSEELRDQLAQGLEKAQLNYEQIFAYQSPRRLAVLVQGLDTRQPDQQIEHRGPSLLQAYEANGQPTKALQGFLKSCGVSLSQLSEEKTEKGIWLVYRDVQKGKSAHELLPQIAAKAMNQLPMKKPMRWGNHPMSFLRPVQWICLLLGSDVLPATLAQCEAQALSYGHRFLSPGPITLEHASDYVAVLQKAYVMVDGKKRRSEIEKGAQLLAKTVGGRCLMDTALLEEVCQLVEWPVPLLASFPSHFLAVPAEALMASMQDHQKCFPMVNAEGDLLPYFITVSNILSKNPEAVIKGNEKVMCARLSDAEFFYEQDKKMIAVEGLEFFNNRLKNIVFQKELGSVYEKVERIQKLALMIYPMICIDRPSESPLASSEILEAAQYCKADLASQLVNEFPELQGIMGDYYMRLAGHEARLGEAIREHYYPRFSGDELPRSLLGALLALADKLDTLIIFFRLGHQPPGDKDPFGLRRAALGLVRIIIEKNNPLDLDCLLEKVQSIYEKPLESYQASLSRFIFDRLTHYYQAQGISPSILHAVREGEKLDLALMNKKVLALHSFLQTEEATLLVAMYKRVAHILNAQKEFLNQYSQGTYLSEKAEIPSETALFLAANEVEEAMKSIVKNEDLGLVFSCLLKLNKPLSVFFENVMVLVDNQNLRLNRLFLLQRIHHLFPVNLSIV